MEYKGKKAKLLMVGTKETVAGWRGELYAAVIQYGGDGEKQSFDVVPDSTDEADLDDLPATETFDSQEQALSYFMKLEKNKDKWK